MDYIKSYLEAINSNPQVFLGTIAICFLSDTILDRLSRPLEQGDNSRRSNLLSLLIKTGGDALVLGKVGALAYTIYHAYAHNTFPENPVVLGLATQRFNEIVSGVFINILRLRHNDTDDHNSKIV